MRGKHLLACGALLIVSACVATKLDPMSVALLYKPNLKNTGLLGGLECHAISALQARDARSEKTLGVRAHESKPLKADVTVNGDPALWVRDGVQGFFAQNGVSLQATGPKLLVTLDSLHTVESVLRRASYDARVGLTVELQSAGGKSCWKQPVEGAAGNYGYAGSVVDYQETTNAALDAASVHLTEAPGFKAALCHCGE